MRCWPFQYQALADPPPVDVTPLSWESVYPDSCPPKRALTAAILAGALFYVGTATLPAPPAVAVTSPAQGSGNPISIRVTQYQSQVAPFYSALAQTPPLTWAQPTAQPYPAKATLYVQSPFFFAGPATLDFGWKTVYPDWFPAKRLPILDGLTFTPSHNPAEGFNLGWSPHYPDRIDRFVYLTANQLPFVTGCTSSVIPLNDIRWKAIYPDRLDPPPRLIEQRAFFFDPYPIPNQAVDAYGWRPTYPDRLDRRGILTALQQSYAANLRPELTIPLAWEPSFPDRIDRLVYLTANQLAWVANLQPEVTSPHAWSVVYPDRIPRFVYLTADQLPFVTSPQPEVTIPGVWLPVYPNWIDRRLYLAANQPAWTFGYQSSNPVPPLGWAPDYPVYLNRILFAASQQETYTANVFPISGGSIIVYKFVVIVGD